ncbi:hypothetical protein AVHY2522_22505 [Acidovorax sp. SUPP2522]|uniref:hypothetical protein n=1 Tax=unclassified Acidovorax TaxID=2684926 RepID=UPI00234B27AA|nr:MULTISPECIES: hypothetical protein [unclassified Acidovorax]WCM97265.1 hypothetical protein M5C96_23200 [Acidovorax sp. GBBC 1281]GKT19449.1 hypothetical protein AVHY2522_22505 [Acidovorax sp. SUPP2522]
MILQIALGSFYSRGDERRLFQGLEEITAIRSVKGVGRDLLIDVSIAALNKEAMRELVALLWRYEIPLAPLRAFAEKKKFEWLNDSQGYWYSAMFKEGSNRRQV